MPTGKNIRVPCCFRHESVTLRRDLSRRFFLTFLFRFFCLFFVFFVKKFWKMRKCMKIRGFSWKINVFEQNFHSGVISGQHGLKWGCGMGLVGKNWPAILKFLKK